MTRPARTGRTAPTSTVENQASRRVPLRGRIGLAAAASIVLLACGVPAAQAATSSTHAGFNIESAKIPASCNHPAARLKNGVKDFGTRANGSSRGIAQLESKSLSNAVPIKDPIHALQRGTSSLGAYEVVPINCTAGNVGWPDVISLYNKKGTILASIDLGQISKQEHASVTAVSLRANHFRAHWDAYDGANFHLHHEAATFTMRHGKLVVSHLDRH
jgi:hypothetical protein